MAKVADNLQQLISLFHLRTSQAIPLATGERLVIAAFDLTETAALAVALVMYLQQQGNGAAHRLDRHHRDFFVLTKEDRYDRTI